jgi:hypothetical protein
MKETFNCPCEKKETVVVRLYDEYNEGEQYFLRLSPQAKRLLDFLEEEDLLTLSIEWAFDFNSTVKEF